MNGKLFEAHKARFDRLCEDAIRTDLRLDDGIGTLGEKRLHAVIKRFLCEDVQCHEVKLEGTRYVSDIRIGNEIYEVQTGAFYPMKRKIAHYLAHTDCTVTVVHPIASVRWLSWVEPKTVEISPRKKISRKGYAEEILPLLYCLLDQLPNPRLHFQLLLLETQDFKLLGKNPRNPKKGSKKYERIPLSLLEEITLDSPADFARFVPCDLPTHFTVKDFSRRTKLRGVDAYSAVRVLTALGLLAPAEPIGRAMAFTRLDQANETET